MTKLPRLALAPLLLAALLGLAACDDDDGNGGATPAATEPDGGIDTPAPTEPGETAEPGLDIRDEDLLAQSGLAEFLTTSNGEVNDERIVYEDLTEDGIDDAVVPVTAGGEGGDIGLFVYGYVDGEVTELLMLNPPTPLRASVQDGALSVETAEYLPGDPACCPSGLATTTYVWDGSALVPSEESE